MSVKEFQVFCFKLFVFFFFQAKYDANQEKLKAASLPTVYKNEPNLLLKFVDNQDSSVTSKIYPPEVPKKNGYIRIPHMMNGSPSLQNI